MGVASWRDNSRQSVGCSVGMFTNGRGHLAPEAAFDPLGDGATLRKCTERRDSGEFVGLGCGARVSYTHGERTAETATPRAVSLRWAVQTFAERQVAQR